MMRAGNMKGGAAPQSAPGSAEALPVLYSGICNGTLGELLQGPFVDLSGRQEVVRLFPGHLAFHVCHINEERAVDTEAVTPRLAAAGRFALDAAIGAVDGVGAMVALSTAMTMVLPYPLIRWLERHPTASRFLVLGTVAMSLKAGAIALDLNPVTFLPCIVVFAPGALLTRPTQQTLLASMADDTARGTFMGLSALAIGGGIGNVAGGWLIDIAREHDAPVLPRLIFCLTGLLSAAGLQRLTTHDTAARA